MMQQSNTQVASHCAQYVALGSAGHLVYKHGLFLESIWTCSLCVSNNTLAAHMNLTSVDLSKSFFILFIFVDYATS